MQTRCNLMNDLRTTILYAQQIGGHNLTVIATDGYPIEPFVVDSFACAPGERFDVVLDATNDPNTGYTKSLNQMIFFSFKI